MMRALSLWQPWASAMARTMCPVKGFETRHWVPREPLPICDVVIHAATRWSGDQLAVCGLHPFRLFMPIAPTIFTRVKDGPEALGLPAGVALCVVDFVKVWRTAEVVGIAKYSQDGNAEAWAEELAMGNYSPGRFAWEANNLRVLSRPVPLRGRQGLWVLSPEEESRVRSALEVADAARR